LAWKLLADVHCRVPERRQRHRRQLNLRTARGVQDSLNRQGITDQVVVKLCRRLKFSGRPIGILKSLRGNHSARLAKRINDEQEWNYEKQTRHLFFPFR